MKKYLILLLFIISFSPSNVLAFETNHYVTIVHPVRGRNLWQSDESVKNQINLIRKNHLPSTWLLQYDVITDNQNSKLFKELPVNQELGVFLEVSERLATDSNVPYIYGSGDWARADKVLFSGYTPAERERMIDILFETFKDRFGYYPVSVGAWYIDTVSLNYLSQKYKIKAAMDVSDQYQTDTYGVWGQPWGAPYYPSQFNSIMPANSIADRLDMVKIQWAARDPVRGYGLKATDSIYSVQANDYVGNNLNTTYFQKLAQAYLLFPNPITQLTVGLEAGQEGAVYYDEYEKQLSFLVDLAQKENLSFLTMSSFAKDYQKQFPNYSPSFFVHDTDVSNPHIEAFWYSNKSYRIGLLLKDKSLFIRDLRLYNIPFLYGDIFTNDKNHLLKRVIPAIIDEALNHNEIMLMSHINKIDLQRDGDNLYLLLVDEAGSKHKISFTNESILLDQKQVLKTPKMANYITQILTKVLMSYWINYPHSWICGWRYSSIEGKFYLGFMIKPDRLIGIKSEMPFLGIFKFPFQVLVRFKSLPQIDLSRLISVYLVNRINHSTIKLTVN